jgi:peptidoglycan/xylan/chitin deacetylase (PgdA/CDA1 family)
VKKLLKRAWAGAWHRSHLLGAHARLRDALPGGNRCAILMFHRVVPRQSRERVHSLAEIVVFADTFERQMRFLAERCRVIPLRELVDALRDKRPPPAGSVVITFDDGWEDNYLHAFPVLQRHGLPATIFLTAGFVDTERLFWQESVLLLAGALRSAPQSLAQCLRDSGLADLCPLADALTRGDAAAARLALIKRLKAAGPAAVALLTARLEAACGGRRAPSRDHSFLSWRQIEAMQGPLVGYGCHGFSHRPLGACDEATALEELRSSKAVLEERLRAPVDTLAYPGGSYSRTTVELSMRLGFAAGLTVEEGLTSTRSDPYRLRRINVHEGRFAGADGRFSPALFAARLAGLL